MTENNKNHKSIYRVVLDHSGIKYSIVPITQVDPIEFNETNKVGLIEECVDYIFRHMNRIHMELASPLNNQSVTTTESDVILENIPLTPVQSRFFGQNPPDPHHWNLSQVFKLKQDVVPELLKQSVYHVIEHHDALRLRFKRDGSYWCQYIAESIDEMPFSQIDVPNLSDQEELSILEAIAAEKQPTLNLTEGPLIRFIFFNFGSGKSAYLLIIVNHLVSDGYSLDILLEDLTTAYHHLDTGKIVCLPIKTTSIREWTQRQVEYAQSREGLKEINYWMSHAETKIGQLPIDKPGGSLTELTARTLTISLTEEESYLLLKKALPSNRATITDALMTALVLAFARWTSMYSWIIELVGHGRVTIFEDIDLSRTMGWLVTHTPVFVTLDANIDTKANLRSVKGQMRLIPNNGFGYEVLRCYAKDVEIVNKLEQLPRSQVIFNFFGRPGKISFSDILSPFDAKLGPTGVHKNVPMHLLIFNGIILDDKLHLMLTYSTEVHNESTIINLLKNITNILSEITDIGD